MKKVFSLVIVLFFTFSLAACGASEESSVPSVDSSTSMSESAQSGPSEEDLGPLTVQDCMDIAELVDQETGNSCLIGVAIEQEDASICEKIVGSDDQKQECLEVMAL